MADAPVNRGEIRDVAVGAVAIALLATILALFYSGGFQEARAGMKAYRIVADFNRIDGLDTGAEVSLSGVPVGRVEAVTLSPSFRVHTTLLIDAGVGLPVDTAASIQTDGLLGAKSMVLDPGGDERMLTDGGAIAYTQDAVVVSDLLDLIIAEGRSTRAAAAAEGAPAGEGAAAALADQRPGQGPEGLLGGDR